MTPRQSQQSLQQQIELELVRRQLAKRLFPHFVTYTFPAYKMTPLHETYAKILDLFAKRIIRKLIISMPPQHGKSELSTRRLPAYMLGHDPDLNIAIASYGSTFVRKFSVDIQRIIASQEYNNIFPDTTIMRNKWSQETEIDYLKTKDEFQIINSTGSVMAVGRGGALTGNPVDRMIMDDLYKDYAEGNSPIIRESVIDWYKSVVRSRLHNDSQELIVFTRWNEDDLIGWLEKMEQIILITHWNQLKRRNIVKSAWYKINIPALMIGEPTEIDTREEGEPFWPARHSATRLIESRNLDEEKFESLYQGDPRPRAGLLYSGFNVWKQYPEFRYIRNYTDTADKGDNFLCSICYGVGTDDMIYILDVYYTNEPHETTEPETADLLIRNRIKEAIIESNNGGRGFARNVDRLAKYKILIKWFHQSANKESRIVSNSAEVQRRILFPVNWTTRWPLFAKHLLGFKKKFKGNRFDDAPDTLTGVLEHSGLIIDDNALWQM